MLRQLAGPALQGFVSNKPKTFHWKLLITRVCLRKNKTNEPQTLRDKTTCPSSLYRTGGNKWWNSPGGAGKGWSHQSHLHPAPWSQGSSNQRKCDKNWDRGCSLQGRDAFCHPEKSLYGLCGDVTKTLQQQPQKHSASWFKGR